MMPGAFPVGSVTMGVCKKRILGSIAQGTTTFATPSDFNNGDNIFGTLGPGGDGGNGGAGVGGGGGAGAGAIAWLWQLTLTQGATTNVQVGAHGSTNKTIFDTGGNTVVADYGRSSSGATKGLGGVVANCTGTVKFKGGDGSDSGNLLSGGGSGGAPDFKGAGGDATAPSGVNSGGGGTNGSGLVGGIPVTTTAVGNPGATGREWDGIEGSGSGASGAGGISGIGASDNGAVGGLYGSGGSGGNTSLSGSTGGAGKDGRIWYSYYPIQNGTTYSVSISEAGGAAETVSGALVAVGAAVEVGAFADTVSALGTFGVNTAETGAFADSPSALAVFASTTTETGTLADSASSIGAFGVSAAETGAFVDTGSAATSFLSVLTEAGSLSDSPSAIGVWTSGSTDSVFLIDTLNTAAATYTPYFQLLGGRYGVMTIANPWLGGLIELDIESVDPDQSVGTAASFSTDGYAIVDLPPGQYRFMIFAATNVFASITRIAGLLI